MCGTLHMPTEGNAYYSTTELVTFEENYFMYHMLIRERRTVNRTYVDLAQFVSSKKSNNITMKWITLRQHN